jgi:hypothetical protein
MPDGGKGRNPLQGFNGLGDFYPFTTPAGVIYSKPQISFPSI